MSDVSDERLAELISLVLPEPQAIGKRLATDIRAALRELQSLRAGCCKGLAPKSECRCAMLDAAKAPEGENSHHE